MRRREAVDRVANGFEALFLSEYPRLVTVRLLVGLTHVEAEDAVQEALVAVLRHWDSVSQRDDRVALGAQDRLLQGDGRAAIPQPSHPPGRACGAAASAADRAERMGRDR